MMGYFHTAQICLNGHCITNIANIDTDHLQNFCDKCGAKTITCCPNCNATIRGNYYDGGIFTSIDSLYNVPSFCYNCGKPFPWISTAIETISEVISEETEICDIEKEKLITSLPDIVSETPKTKLAVTRMKKALLSVGKFTADSIRQFIIDFGCELAKNLINTL